MKVTRIVLGFALLLFPVMSFAAGSGLQTTSGVSQTGTSTVTVTIPAVIGVDVESDIFFDFSNAGLRTFNQTYTAPTAASSAACADNVWPPAAGCTGAVRYDPSVAVTVGVPAGAADHLWLAIFSSKSGAQATMDLNAKISAFANSPGFASTSVRYATGTSNNAAVNGSTFGGAVTNFTVAGASIRSAAMSASTLPWSRIDQKIDMSIATGSSTSFNNANSPYTATITYTLSY